MGVRTKNQLDRTRKESPGEAGSEGPAGFASKPQLDEDPKRHADASGEGLRGDDKQETALKNQGPPSEKEDALPEGLRRERTHPLDPTDGRGDRVPPHIPGASTQK